MFELRLAATPCVTTQKSAVITYVLCCYSFMTCYIHEVNAYMGGRVRPSARMFKHENIGQISKKFSCGLNRRTIEYGKSFRANLSPVKVQYICNSFAETGFVSVLQKLIVAQQVKKIYFLRNEKFSYRLFKLPT